MFLLSYMLFLYWILPSYPILTSFSSCLCFLKFIQEFVYSLISSNIIILLNSLLEISSHSLLFEDFTEINHFWRRYDNLVFHNFELDASSLFGYFKKYFYFFVSGFLPECKSKHHMHIRCPWRPEKGDQIPWNRRYKQLQSPLWVLGFKQGSPLNLLAISCAQIVVSIYSFQSILSVEMSAVFKRD